MARYNKNISSLDTPGTIRSLLTLDKPATVAISKGRISGVIKKNYIETSNFTVMAELFANWQTDDAAIVRFTRRYGPLQSEWITGEQFAFDAERWREWQRVFRDTWRNLPALQSQLTQKPNFEKSGNSLFRQIQLAGNTFLRYQNGAAALLLSDMRTVLDVCCMLIPLGDFRICKSSECKKPYFVAHRSDQTICDSNDCKDWNRRRLKREWFEREKGAILAERKRKRDSDGTQKTR